MPSFTSVYGSTGESYAEMHNDTLHLPPTHSTSIGFGLGLVLRLQLGLGLELGFGD